MRQELNCYLYLRLALAPPDVMILLIRRAAERYLPQVRMGIPVCQQKTVLLAELVQHGHALAIVKLYLTVGNRVCLARTVVKAVRRYCSCAKLHTRPVPLQACGTAFQA